MEILARGRGIGIADFNLIRMHLKRRDSSRDVSKIIYNFLKLVKDRGVLNSVLTC